MIRKYWILISISIAVLVFLFVISKSDFSESAEEELFEVPVALEAEVEIKEQNNVEQIVIVDVKGEVNFPGIYEVDGDSRVHDVIQIAGGLTSDAEDNAVNLAQRVSDEMVINVPKIGEQPIIASTSSLANDKVVINNASLEEIGTLSGIGPKKAEAIIKHREENGRFETVEDLLQVSGIGEKTLENIRDELQIP